MANFPITEEVEYSDQLRMFEKEDPAHADLFNAITKQLLYNDVFIKKVVDQLVENVTSLNVNKIDKETLNNVDNTHDIDKPVSVPVQEALDAYYAQLTAYADKAIADVINGAPTTMDTLSELADAIKKNQDVQAALDAAIGTKASKAEYDTHTATAASKTVAGHVKVDDAMSASSTNPVQNKVVKSALDGKSNTGHTHNYAGSSTAGGSATSAEKLSTSTAGAANKPAYFKDGKPVACSYEVNKSVPADADFTNTTYGNMTAATKSADGKAGLVPAPAKGDNTKFLRGDGTWQDPTEELNSNLGNLVFCVIDLGCMPIAVGIANYRTLPNGFTYENTCIIAIRLLRENGTYIYSNDGLMVNLIINNSNQISVNPTADGVKYCAGQRIRAIIAKTILF